MKIATILPYKENYTFAKAQAAAIWVSDFYKNSKFRDQNFIFGNTNTKDFLTKNYVNIKINNLKSKFNSVLLVNPKFNFEFFTTSILGFIAAID